MSILCWDTKGRPEGKPGMICHPQSCALHTVQPVASMLSSITSTFGGQHNVCQLTSHALPAAGPLDSQVGSNGPAGYHAARRSLTNLSELGAEKSPESASRFRPPPDSLEAQLSHKLQASCSISQAR